MKKTELSLLNGLFAEISAIRTLYLPSDNASGQADFTRWHEGVQLSSQPNTVRSAKDLFFPQVENIIGYKTSGKTIEMVETRGEAEDFVLFGVRACDVRSFAILDRVFLAEPADTFYRSRRNHGLVISMACGDPSRTCFCTAFGIDPAAPEGDISCWMDDRYLYWQENTEKGAALTGRLTCLTPCDAEAILPLQEQTREKLKKQPLASLPLKKFGSGKTQKLFDRPEWAELSSACLGCGTCTFVCPTCQCYDIEEFNDGHTVRRFRCWDSCMYSDFTKMSAGQPRPTQKERFRQRFMHKLVYYPENNDGSFGCVGCGRCVRKCPIHMHIVKVIHTLGGDGHDV